MKFGVLCHQACAHRPGTCGIAGAMGGSGIPPPSELLPLLPLLLRLSLVSTVLWLRRLRVGDKIWGRGCWGAAPPPHPSPIYLGLMQRNWRRLRKRRQPGRAPQKERSGEWPPHQHRAPPAGG